MPVQGNRVLYNAKWWSWYGGWFWGPRFFLFASIPAAFLIAVHLHHAHPSLARNILTLAVLVLSLWVGVNGAIFDQKNLESCTRDHYALEALCWYVPEFSLLWRPFVVSTPLSHEDVLIMAYYLVVGASLTLPLLREVMAQVMQRATAFWRAPQRDRAWRF
jgi:hypothetical protein